MTHDPPHHGAGARQATGRPEDRDRRRVVPALRRRLGDLRPWQRRRHRRGAVRRRATSCRPTARTTSRPWRMRPSPSPRPSRRRRMMAVHDLDRPRRDQHGDGRRGGPCEPPAGAAAARRRLRQPPARSRCCSRSRISATARSRPTTASARSRAISTASPGPSRSSRRFNRAMPVLTDPADCGPVTLALCQDVQAEAFDYPESFFAERIWTPRRAAPGRRASLPRRSALLKRAHRSRSIIAGGGVLYSRGRGARSTASRGARHSGRRDAGAASRTCRTTTRSTWARSASPAPARPTRWPRRPT